MSIEARTDTREAILEAARATVQRHGYNALSYRDLGKEVGVKSSSVHYHFPTKADLGEALAERYADDFAVLLEDLADKFPQHDDLLQAYANVFRGGLEDGDRMCLCSVMAAEISALPQAVRLQIDRFNKINVAFLYKSLRNRHPDAEAAKLEVQALAIFAAVEGAQLIAHGRGSDLRTFDDIVAGYTASGLFS